MSKSSLVFRLLTFAVFTLALAAISQAQATRTWVSGVGDDVNPCSRTAPCKTFAGAISKTATNGEINCLDPAGYGAVTITKSITIDCEDTQGSILASGTTGVIVSLTASPDVQKSVTLRGLSINGTGSASNSGIRGVNVTTTNNSPVNLTIEEVVIANFVNEGVLFSAPGGNFLFRDSRVTNCGTKGIMLDSEDANVVHATIQNSSLTKNQEGLRAETNVRATVMDSNISLNTLNGVVILTVGGTAEFNISDTIVANNRQHGISIDASGGGAIARINNVTVTNNTGVVGGFGLRTANGGQILSAGNNVVDGNTNNGVVTGAVPKQ